MKKIITTEKAPIKLWLDDIEESALKQARNLANLPFVFKHIAIMPDCHTGYGMPIGGVLATKDVIIPNAVGVDIGCGICTIKTGLTSIKESVLKKIIHEIKDVIPVGFKHHKSLQPSELLPPTTNLPENGIIKKEFEAARKQVGTLGGGNHFIEIQHGSDGHIWIMIHSGSRNIGLKVAQHYNKIAKQLNKHRAVAVDPKHDLAFLPMEETVAKDYFDEMQYCVDFALANRKFMMQNIISIFTEYYRGNFEEIDFINIAHNYAARENHFNTDVIIHRKGATRAYFGERGVIPGSQGSKSYIVAGKGNKESFMSCSHGAGRKMGRKQAQRELNLEEQKAFMDQQGILHSIRSTRDLDEAPAAYKNIDIVMENQSDLVEIQVELKPLAVVKG